MERCLFSILANGEELLIGSSKSVEVMRRVIFELISKATSCAAELMHCLVCQITDLDFCLRLTSSFNNRHHRQGPNLAWWQLVAVMHTVEDRVPRKVGFGHGPGQNANDDAFYSLSKDGRHRVRKFVEEICQLVVNIDETLFDEYVSISQDSKKLSKSAFSRVRNQLTHLKQKVKSLRNKAEKYVRTEAEANPSLLSSLALNNQVLESLKIQLNEDCKPWWSSVIG